MEIIEKRGDPQLNENLVSKYEKVPIELIDVEGQSVRDEVDDDHIVELAMSIAKHGLLEPIVLREKDGGRYQLEAGFHRLSAVRRLNWATIPAHIRPANANPVKSIALIENIIRRNMTLEEEIKAVNYLHSEEGLSPSSICDLLGKSRTWVDQRLAIPNYPEDVKMELLDGNLSISKAEIISQVKDDGTRAFIINQVISAKLTAKQTHDLVEMYLATPSIQSAVEAGIQEKKKIQETSKSYRKCEICGQIKELMELKFVTICQDVVECNKKAIEEFENFKEEEKNV